MTREGYRIDYIEKMGTGIRRMQKLLQEAGLAPLRYEFSGFVRAVFPRPNQATPQATPQAAEQATAQVTVQVTAQAAEQAEPDKVAAVLEFCRQARSRDEIMAHIGLSHREHFRTAILQPLLEAGFLQPTIPDKPTSPKQKYLTRIQA